MKRKRFFARHAKSSAAFISFGIHAVLLVVALSFVAVTVITKEDQVFVAKKVARPRVQLKKLQVPVNIKKKKTQKPKLRKRIVVQPKLTKVPEIKMPEITGVKGGMGSAGAGLGGGGSLGFAMPEMELFGIKSRGEKVFIILDASAVMMVDSMGGIPAYTIIKSELVRILDGLNPTILFNVAVFGGGDYALFPNMVAATSGNVAKVDAWLKPLNAVSRGMGNRDYGARTLGPGGFRIRRDFEVEPLKETPGEWARAALLAMEQQADVVFLLTCRWGNLLYKTGTRDRDWSGSDQAEYLKNLAKARKLHQEENDRRRASGQPPRVVAGGNAGLVRTYVRGARVPPLENTYERYTPEEMIEALDNMRGKRKAPTPLRSGVGKGVRYSINVIQFVKAKRGSGKEPRFQKLTSKTRGEYKTIEGLAEIQSYVSDGDE